MEPNNTSATAQALFSSTQTEVRGAITPVGDQDFFQFSATAGDRVWAYVFTTGATSSTDSQITLTTTTPTNLQFDDDNGSQAALSSGIAGFPITATGSYQVKINPFSATATVNPYTLFLDRTSGAGVPETEPNETMPTANALPSVR